QGYQRVLLEGQMFRVDEVTSFLKSNDRRKAPGKSPTTTPGLLTDTPTKQRAGTETSDAKSRVRHSPSPLLRGEGPGERSAMGRVRRPYSAPQTLTVIQDRLKLSSRPRFIEACEQAYHFGKGKLTVWELHPPSSILHPRPFSNRL